MIKLILLNRRTRAYSRLEANHECIKERKGLMVMVAAVAAIHAAAVAILVIGRLSALPQKRFVAGTL
jgi:hypothetical protein